MRYSVKVLWKQQNTLQTPEERKGGDPGKRLGAVVAREATCRLPGELCEGWCPPGRVLGKRGQCQQQKQACLADTTHAACSAREGSLPGMGHREEISCGRNWPRGAGTQPAKCPWRAEAERLPAFGRHWLPAGLGSRERSMGLMPGMPRWERR